MSKLSNKFAPAISGLVTAILFWVICYVVLIIYSMGEYFLSGIFVSFLAVRQVIVGLILAVALCILKRELSKYIIYLTIIFSNICAYILGNNEDLDFSNSTIISQEFKFVAMIIVLSIIASFMFLKLSHKKLD